MDRTTAAPRLWAGIVHLLALLLLSQPLQASSSSLSRWLSDDAIPDIAEVLGAHPRVAGQPVTVLAPEGDGLGEAVVTVLLGNLAHREDIDLAAPAALPQSFANSVDDLSCQASASDAPSLLVTARSSGGRSASVVIALTDAGETEAAWRRWQWQGSLSRAEIKALESQHGSKADGTIAAPWDEGEVQQAALALGNSLACDLKRQLPGRVVLDWQAGVAAPATISDVFSVSRHLLGGLREVDLAEGGDLRIEARVEPLQQGVLQLWLQGVPRDNRFAPVQAVTYIRGTLPVLAVVETLRSRSVSQPPLRREAARNFIDVRMLDLNQSDRPLAAADLQVQLQLVNRGQWPIQYAFSISAGHYLNCVAEPGYYRHDRYGYLEGEIPAGDSQLRAIDIPGVQHKPNPWFGPRKCAGFKDLEGFENFNDKGYKVTEFVRWSM